LLYAPKSVLLTVSLHETPLRSSLLWMVQYPKIDVFMPFVLEESLLGNWGVRSEKNMVNVPSRPRTARRR
jgi:hypothetical protein